MKYLASRILGEGTSHLFEGERREHSQALYQGVGLGLLFTGDKAAEGLARDTGVRKESEQELPRRWISEHQERCLWPHRTETHRGGISTRQGLRKQPRSWASPSQAPSLLLVLTPQRAVSILTRASLLTSRPCACGHTGHGAGRGQDRRLGQLTCSHTSSTWLPTAHQAASPSLLLAKTLTHGCLRQSDFIGQH